MGRENSRRGEEGTGTGGELKAVRVIIARM